MIFHYAFPVAKRSTYIHPVHCFLFIPMKAGLFFWLKNVRGKTPLAWIMPFSAAWNMSQIMTMNNSLKVLNKYGTLFFLIKKSKQCEALCFCNEIAMRTNTLEVQKQNSRSKTSSCLHAIKITKQYVSSWVTILLCRI